VRSFRRFATRCLVSALCLATLIAPLAGIIMVSGAASAQSTMEVSVVDFRNTSKIPNEMFGTMATDAVVVELLRSGKFSVTTADALQGKMEELGYKAKDDRVPKVLVSPAMMVRLGQEVGADAIVTGEITSLKVDGGKKAEAKITVRMLDVASGVWMNGAIATGASNPRIGYTADKDTDLIIEAINNAARQAVDSMVQYIIPEATIIGTFGAEEVLLNKGAQDGVQNGMEFIVLRRGETGQDEVVGRIRIVNASDTDAKAAVVSSTRGLKPEDRVRAVFDLPKDTGANAKPSRTDTQKKIAKGSSLLWGLVALVGVATLFKGGGDKPEQVSNAIAMAGKYPDVTSVWQDGGVLVAWNDPRPLRTADILEYHVLRDDMMSVIPQGAALKNAGPAVVCDRMTALQRTVPTGTYERSTVDGTWFYITVDYSYADENHARATGTAAPTQGMIMGIPHTYYVSALYRRHTTAADGSDVVTYWETQPVYAGRATYTSRPVTESPGGTVTSDYVDLTNVTFEWRGAAGADQYVIEISTSPDFKRSETWVDVIYQPTSQDGTLFTKTYTNVLKNADTGATVTELANVPAGGTLFWRVGARNRTDSPGPIPAGLQYAQVSGAKNTRYIYSDPSLQYSFMTLPDMPGPPPSGGDTGGGTGGDTPPAPPGI
jgi:hypothetical protein